MAGRMIRISIRRPFEAIRRAPGLTTAKVADLPADQQKAIAASSKPRRAANAAIEAVNNGDQRIALRKAWERARALRRLLGSGSI